MELGVELETRSSIKRYLLDGVFKLVENELLDSAESSSLRIGTTVPRKYGVLSKVNQRGVYLWLQITYNFDERNNVTTG